MEIKNFVKIYDDVIPAILISSLIKYLNVSNFNQAKILGTDGETIDTTIRKTNTCEFSNLSNSLTNVHWFHILKNMFTNYVRKYKEDTNTIDFYIKDIRDIIALKYVDKGFYTWHTDHAAKAPRTMSCILLLNNDYEGGNLCFRNPDGSGEWEVEVKPSRLIIWPSNFLYPHTVKTVKKGTRYSVVAWAL